MNPAVLGVMIPIIAVGGSILAGILKMMTKHQREMAELYHRNGPQPAIDPRIDALQRDMADLKDLVHKQTIALDRIATPLPSAEIRERIGS